MTGSSLKDLLRSLWSELSERDKQRLVGASNLSNECTKCLAEEMALALVSQEEMWDRPESKYVMGAKIGTAVHLYLEEEVKKRNWGVSETKVVVGEIEGYGVINSTSDLYVAMHKAIVDHKTTTKEKLDVIRTLIRLGRLDDIPEIEMDVHRVARKKIKRYLVQGNLYGKGAEDRGDAVEVVALNFIPRDAKVLDDMYVLEVEYDREIAERALARGQKIWDALVAGKPWHSFKSDIDCYNCNVVRKPIN